MFLRLHDTYTAEMLGGHGECKMWQGSTVYTVSGCSTKVAITQEMSIKNTLIHSRSFLETKNNLYPFSDRNGANTVPFGAAHSYMAHIREYPPRGGRGEVGSSAKFENCPGHANP